MGEAVALLGESGCGKSTLGLSITRLLPSPPAIMSGEVFFEGKDLFQCSEEEIRAVRGKRISMIFQDPASYLNPVMKIYDQLMEAVRGSDESDQQICQRIYGTLELVRLPRTAVNLYPHELSGGMKQRVVITMGILPKPSLIVADEPTTALDVTVEAQIMSVLGDLINKLGASLLLITHNWGLVAEICDTVNVMYAGEIVECGETYEVYEGPFHPYTKGLLGCLLEADKKLESAPFIPGMPPNLINPPSGCRFHTRCPSVMAKCLENRPPRIKMGRRFVYCHLYG